MGEQKKLKKLKKLNKLKAKQALLANEKNDESKCEKVDIVKEMGMDKTDVRSDDVRDVNKGLMNGNHHREDGNNEKEEEELRKPPWLQSSYFQKGNFDQKTLHLSFHPKKDVIAAVSGSQLLVFQKL